MWSKIAFNRRIVGPLNRRIRFFVMGGIIFLLVGLLCFSQSTEAADHYHQKADTYWDQAQKLEKHGNYREAAQFYEKSAEAEQQSPQSRVGYLADEIAMAGYCYKQMGQYQKAFESYARALHIYQELDRDVEIAITLEHTGEICYMLGDYTEALASFELALELDRKLGRELGMSISLNGIGIVYDEWGQYDKAIEYYEQSLEIVRKIGEDARIAVCLNNIGMVYKKWGKYDKALEYFEQALELEQSLDNDTDIAVTLNNIGAVYEDQGLYDKALRYYQQALEIDRELGRKAEIAIRLNNIGIVYNAWGQYDKALEYFEQSLEIDRKLGKKAGISVTLNNIGEVYRMWGQYTKALDYYEQSLEIEKELGRDAEIATRLNNIGIVHSTLQHYATALEYYQQALKLDRKLGRTANVATKLNNIGAIYMKLGHNENAIDYYQQALELQLTLDSFSGIDVSANNIGMIFKIWERYDDALVFYNHALTVARKLGNEASIATYLHNIGGLYYGQEKYAEAIPYFADAVVILEKIRKTATGDARRDYFASQIGTYRFLISCYMRIGDFENAFEIIELSRAKQLEERLGGAVIEARLPSLEHFQQTLPEDMAVLIYANTVEQHIAQMFMTKDTFSASERSFGELAQNTMPPDSTNIIEQYRTQLFKPSFSRGPDMPERAALPNLNRLLYSFLIGDIQGQLQGKTTLLILPDGILNFLPFETLVDKQGRYLAETYRITYAQSLGVLELIGQRGYKSGRKSLLAFGGAVYEEQTYQEEMAESEAQLAYVRKQIDLALKRRNSLREIYAQLGHGNWENLPGTLAEVKAIQGVLNGAVIMTGSDVNETAVKALSANGELHDYKVLHFATHGDINPQMPELSALVLSLGAQASLPALEKPTPNPSQEGNNAPSPLVGGVRGEGEDGYLRAAEIAKLDIKTDFVNLSACETGLGKLYSGEGVVGLTQAFLLAGANAVSVSVWSVADESTAQFMVTLYSLVENEGLTYLEAMSEVKRRFIAGDFGEAWKAPYFWAPFVYYGK